MAKFKKGDVVTLKSGGKAMTVQLVDDFTNLGIENGVLCVWHDGAKACEHVYDEEVLESYEQPRAVGAVVMKTKGR